MAAKRWKNNSGDDSQLIWLGAVAIVVCGIVAFYNSFDGAFVYDDLGSIRDNRCIADLWNPIQAMSLPLINSGETVARRPVLSFSFAINRAVLGTQPWGYHLINLVIHVSAALLLFGIIRRTMCLERYRKRYGAKSFGLALIVALIWLVHPLQTESVTYIVQRAESLMGMLFLLTLYCAVRGFTHTSPTRKRGKKRDPSLAHRVDEETRWYTMAVAACAIGMGVKEVMVTAPVIVLLYDGCFVSSSYRTALLNRPRFYLALGSTWLVIAIFQFIGAEGASADFTERSPLAYALTQPEVVLYYLRLSVWPIPLVMDYNWPTAQSLNQIVLPVCAISTLLGVTAWGLFHRKWFGFVGAWFFLILAPSSSFAALMQNLEEHRMYLSLAAVVVCAVVVGELFLRWVGLVSTFAPAAGIFLSLSIVAFFISLTIQRNSDYESELRMWSDNVNKRPQSWVAQHNLASVLHNNGKSEQAIKHYEKALLINPKDPKCYCNMGKALLQLGRRDEAIKAFHKAINLEPRYLEAHLKLASLYMQDGDYDRAIHHLERAVEIQPNNPQFRSFLRRAKDLRRSHE